jgi:hypothetical protein
VSRLPAVALGMAFWDLTVILVTSAMKTPLIFTWNSLKSAIQHFSAQSARGKPNVKQDEDP